MEHIWNADRPRVLVLACSDGRFQEEVDEFLAWELQVTHYDRLYLPGGPGALAAGGEADRAARCRAECRFLVEAHKIERVVLLFHGPAPGGPPEAVCADYQRKLPHSSPRGIRAQQETDLSELAAWFSGWTPDTQLLAYHCQVSGARRVGFVPLLAAADTREAAG